VAEEVRAQLQQALHGLSGNTWVHIDSISPKGHRFDASGNQHDKNLHELTAWLDLDGLLPEANSSSGGRSSRQQLQLPFRPKDLLLLSSKQVSSIEDLQQPRCSPWLLALVTTTPDSRQLAAAAAAAAGSVSGGSNGDGCTGVLAEMNLVVFSVPGSPEYQELFGSNSSGWYACSLGSLATSIRTFDALQQLGKLGEPACQTPILRHILSPPAQQARASLAATAPDGTTTSQPGQAMSGSAMGSLPQILRAVQSYCQQAPALNLSQQAVLLQVASGTSGSSRHRGSSSSRVAAGALQVSAAGGWGHAITLVQGPPGTGKTATTTRLLSVLGCCGSRVLACAPTNVAVCQLAGRYLQLLDSKQQFAAAGSSNPRATSGVNSSSNMTGMQLQQLGRGDVLLVGSGDRLDLSDDLLSVFLPARVQRLMGIAGPMGLLQSLQSVKHVLSPGLLTEWTQDQQQLQQQGGAVSAAASFEGFLLFKVAQLQHDLQQQLQVVQDDLPVLETSDLLLQLLAVVATLQRLQDALLSAQQAGAADTSCSSSSPGSCVLSAFKALRTRQGSQADFRAVVESPAGPDDQPPAWLPAAVQAVRASTAAQAAIPNSLKQRPNAFRLQQLCLQSCRHLFCTVAAVGSGVMTGAGSFDVAVIDEAAQLVEAETAILLARTCCPKQDKEGSDEDAVFTGGAKGQFSGTQTEYSREGSTAGDVQLQHLVLVGDPKQLPATVISQRAEQLGYSRSLFERLQQQGHPVLLLDVQYRCRQEISLWPRQQYYGGNLQDGANVCDPGYGASVLGSSASSSGGLQLQPFLMLDVAGSFEERGTGSADTSISNPMEVDVVMYLLRYVCLPAAQSASQLSVGVISPYRRQVAAIMQQCTSSSSSASSSFQMGGMQVDVRSVDGFQGSERDVIILSAVRSNPQRSIGFLTDPRRLNVAVTRARFSLVVVGNCSTLSADPVWSSLIQSARQRGLLRVLSPAPGDDKLLASLHGRLHQRHWEEQLLRGQAKLFTGCPWQVSIRLFKTQQPAMAEAWPC
jgi:hypothetical protein